MSVVTYTMNNHISVIKLNRPERMNSFNLEMYSALNDAIATFINDKDAWVAVLAAEGDKAFSVGVDLAAVDAMIKDGTGLEKAQHFNIDIQGESYCPKPIIAAIQGYCIGEGLSTVLGCDLRIAGESATFSLPEAKVGVPTINASIHGTRIMGISNALELLLLGEQRDAAWAYRTGLVNLVVPDDKILDTAMEWAEKISALSPLANKITKEVAVRSQSQSFKETVAVALENREAYYSSHDVKEGPRAFLEKRKPNFIGA